MKVVTWRLPKKVHAGIQLAKDFGLGGAEPWVIQEKLGLDYLTASGIFLGRQLEAGTKSPAVVQPGTGARTARSNPGFKPA